MKKALAIILSICFVLCLTACSKDKTASDVMSDNSQITSTENQTSDLTNSKESTESSKPTETNKPTHTHSYSAATCTEPAKCFCGATAGKALGHKWNSPSCGQLKECTICGFTEGLEAEHNYITTISKNATCSDEGEKNIKCERCGHEYTENIERIAHNFVKGRCVSCKEFQEFYINGSEKFLDEVLGVKFYYVGIEDGYWIKLRVENANDVPVLIQTRNGSINGNKFVNTVLSNNIAPNATAEVSLFPGDLFYNYGYDSINSAEFNFYVHFLNAGLTYSDKYLTSEKTIKLYPYE